MGFWGEGNATGPQSDCWIYALRCHPVPLSMCNLLYLSKVKLNIYLKAAVTTYNGSKGWRGNDHRICSNKSSCGSGGLEHSVRAAWTESIPSDTQAIATVAMGAHGFSNVLGFYVWNWYVLLLVNYNTIMLSINNLPTRQTPGPEGLGRFYEMAKKGIIPIFHRLRKHRRGHLSVHFMRPTVPQHQSHIPHNPAKLQYLLMNTM